MSAERLCYLDNNATTRVAPEVFAAMEPFLREQWGNPSSAYRFGRAAHDAIEAARAAVGALIGAEAREIVFTSCGTEATNAALHSALATQPGRRHVVTTRVEHSATLKYCQKLEKQGVEVTWLPVEPDGTLDLGELQTALRDDTAIVSVMLANNETGVLFPVDDIAAVCRAHGVLCHTDAVQTPGKIPLDVRALGVDFASFSAHKLYAPKGVGALYVRRGTRFEPLLVGGSQESGRRGGTENVPYIAGFGRAAELAAGGLLAAYQEVKQLRDRLEAGILRRIPGTSLNGHRTERLPNTTNIAFEGVEAEGLLLMLDQVGICASGGSACTTGQVTPSHVLTAMGLSAARAKSSVRFSLGIYNTEADVDHALEQLPRIVQRLRDLAPPDEPVRRPARADAVARSP
ncbi:MAG: cysteine desulfurase NifS [Limisphaerales bacterium]